MIDKKIDRLQYAASALRFVAELGRLKRMLAKYDPNQPRAPAGRPEGGQWVSYKMAGPYNELNRVKCEQAMVRHTACMKDLSIPDLIYLLGSLQ